MKKKFNLATMLIVATLFAFNACLLTEPYIPYVPIENGETTSVLLSFKRKQYGKTCQSSRCRLHHANAHREGFKKNHHLMIFNAKRPCKNPFLGYFIV